MPYNRNRRQHSHTQSAIMEMTRTPCTVLFADVCDSTRLYEEKGDKAAQAAIATVLDDTAVLVARHGGRIIKKIGDELMCAFPSPVGAVRAALQAQEMHADNLPLRIGLLHGPVLNEEGDLFGDVVNLAARLTAAAKGGQILTVRETAEQLPEDLRAMTRHLDTLSVKGKRDPVPVYEILVEEDEATRLMSGLFEMPPAATSLTITAAGAERIMTQDAPPLRFGRGHLADIAVEDARVSRQHATLQFRRDKFVLADHSSNGTYLEIAGEPHYVRREEIEIFGSGRISLGRPFDDPACAPLPFTCH